MYSQYIGGVPNQGNGNFQFNANFMGNGLSVEQQSFRAFYLYSTATPFTDVPSWQNDFRKYFQNTSASSPTRLILSPNVHAPIAQTLPYNYVAHGFLTNIFFGVSAFVTGFPTGAAELPAIEKVYTLKAWALSDQSALINPEGSLQGSGTLKLTPSTKRAHLDLQLMSTAGKTLSEEINVAMDVDSTSNSFKTGFPALDVQTVSGRYKVFLGGAFFGPQAPEAGISFCLTSSAPQVVSGERICGVAVGR